MNWLDRTSWFHRHSWVEQERFTVTRPSSIKVDCVFDTDAIERISAGRTIFVLRCSDCGDIKHVEVPGYKQ
jgi:hypothetical protein